ncbi:hypothetical protein [Actinomadura opuntiae]|uniref:hypothetical protein n=1 Tax=Actinomadura sp. OS1-43 TaxID=604315 RepID=UPI00255AF252|nr:hypothetical protein [Actinomadura sp. OS1-43]MDL4817207.1 hypothetical protein [Actinomadura sp. OS1-43]
MIEVRGAKEVDGLGRLHKGWIIGGGFIADGDIRGERARLFRDGVLIGEDLRLGILIRKLSPLSAMGFPSRCLLAIGHGDLRKGDRIEVYSRPAASGGDPALVPGYQDRPDLRRELGRAEIAEVADSPGRLPVARVGSSAGRLAVGDRVRVLRGGRPVAEALRLLAMADPGGRPVGDVSAGGGASLYLGFPDLRAGDTVVAFDVPPPARTEHRANLLGVRSLKGATPEAAYAEATADTLSPGAGLQPAVGLRARVLRRRVVIADGRTIVHCPDRNSADQAMRFVLRSAKGNSAGALTTYDIGLTFPELQKIDEIEVYRVIPAEQTLDR